MNKDEFFKENVTQIRSALKFLGLTSSEIKVYNALLEYGIASPNTVSIVTKLTRPSCYDHLKSLHKQGLIFRTDLSDKIAYGIEDPIKIIKKLKDQKEILNLQMTIASSAIKNLRISYKKFSYPKVKYYEGFEVIKEMYNSTLNTENNEVLSFLFGKFYPSELEDFIVNEYIPMRVKNNIELKLITDLKFLIDKDKEHLRERVLIKQRVFPKVEINIYNDNVLFISFSDHKYSGIKIENKEISDALRELHHIIKLSNS